MREKVRLLFAQLFIFFFLFSSEINATLRSTSYILLPFKWEFFENAQLKYPPKMETQLSLPGVQHIIVFSFFNWSVGHGDRYNWVKTCWHMVPVRCSSSITSCHLQYLLKTEKPTPFTHCCHYSPAKDSWPCWLTKEKNMLFISVTPFKTWRLFRSHSSIWAWQRSALRRAQRLTGKLAESSLLLSEPS